MPDIITGTSIGAVIGGCYAAGKLDEVEEWARGLTRRSLLSYLDVSFCGLRPAQRRASSPRSSPKPSAIVTIDKLPVRYAAIATEIGTGHEIWITRGRLTDALRASYALPGIFPPVRLGERWLVDGALVNPVPVSVARALGARLVIAVNVNTDLFGRGTAVPDLGAGARTADRGGGRKPRPVRPVRRGKDRQAPHPRDREPARAFRASWSRRSTSCRTASRARGSRAIRPTS